MVFCDWIWAFRALTISRTLPTSPWVPCSVFCTHTLSTLLGQVLIFIPCFVSLNKHILSACSLIIVEFTVDLENLSRLIQANARSEYEQEEIYRPC